MSKLRQVAIFDPRRASRADISSVSYAYKSGHTVPRHFHEQDQILYGIAGVMAVTTPQGLWIVPPHRAVWIPAKTVHSIQIWGPLTMKTLYLKPKLVSRLGRRCCLVNVSALLRELLLEVCNLGNLYRRTATHARLIGVVTDQLAKSASVPLQMPMPSDPRAVRAARLALASPEISLDELCRECGASKRTLERLFQQETGVSFGRWRQQSSLVRAVQLLAEGNKVTTVAYEVGYSSQSAFIAMFRKSMGATPTRYLAG